MRTLSFVLTTAFAVAACGGRQADIDHGHQFLPPMGLESALLLVDQRAPAALLYDVGEDPLPDRATEVELPYDPIALFRRNGEDEALVLCLGRRADGEHAVEPAALVAVSGSGDARTYELGNPFRELIQSEDGRYAFLLKGEQSGRLLDNPNEVAIVDLGAGPKDDGAVTLRTLRSFGDSPRAVVFSPEMMIAGEARRLAVVLSDTNVTLLDLDHLDRRETTVQLTSEGSASVVPSQIAFNPDAPEIYVRADGSSDVYVFNLSPRAEGEPNEDGEPRNDFRPFIDQLGVLGAPSDMALYASDAGNRLLVLSSGAQTGFQSSASVVDASTSNVTAVALPSAASRALIFSATSPRDQTLRPRALLYQQGQAQLQFLDLEDLEERGSRNLETLSLHEPIEQLVPMLEEGRVLVLHGGERLSLIDLAGRTVSPITTSVPLEQALFDHERRRLWVGPRGQRFVGWLELDTGDTRETLLDQNIQHVVPLLESGRLVVMHPSEVGHLTVLDADEPTREAARSVRGFLAAGLLNRGE
jgi:hypothetical protein